MVEWGDVRYRPCAVRGLPGRIEFNCNGARSCTSKRSELVKSLRHRCYEMAIHVTDGPLLHRLGVSIRRFLVTKGTCSAGTRSWHRTEILWYT